MSGESICIKCGGTGVTANGEPCTCGIKTAYEIPICVNVPVQYQGVRFNSAFLRSELQIEYGNFMNVLLKECTDNIYQFRKNYILCAPPQSGKMIWAYTVYGILFARGMLVPEIMDLMQAREIMLNYYQDDRKALELMNSAPIAVIKLPWDLPNKFPETISTIVERRVRNNCSTIFLFNGTKAELQAKDTFGKLRLIEGDGSFNSVCIKSWTIK